jgi:hypothetical protein
VRSGVIRSISSGAFAREAFGARGCCPFVPRAPQPREHILCVCAESTFVILSCTLRQISRSAPPLHHHFMEMNSFLRRKIIHVAAAFACSEKPPLLSGLMLCEAQPSTKVDKRFFKERKKRLFRNDDDVFGRDSLGM